MNNNSPSFTFVACWIPDQVRYDVFAIDNQHVKIAAYYFEYQVLRERFPGVQYPLLLIDLSVLYYP